MENKSHRKKSFFSKKRLIVLLLVLLVSLIFLYLFFFGFESVSTNYGVYSSEDKVIVNYSRMGFFDCPAYFDVLNKSTNKLKRLDIYGPSDYSDTLEGCLSNQEIFREVNCGVKSWQWFSGKISVSLQCLDKVGSVEEKFFVNGNYEIAYGKTSTQFLVK